MHGSSRNSANVSGTNQPGRAPIKGMAYLKSRKGDRTVSVCKLWVRELCCSEASILALPRTKVQRKNSCSSRPKNVTIIYALYPLHAQTDTKSSRNSDTIKVYASN